MNVLDQVTRRFSHAAKVYHEHATVQKECASQLVNFFQITHKSVVNGPCLEIGCGTGFVTELILPLCRNHNWNITDISPDMVYECRHRIRESNFQNLDFYCVNGEDIDDQSEYAMIISGMTFQWFRNLDMTLSKLMNALRKGGVLCFSILTSKSFPEWRQMCKETGVPFTGHPLPTKEDVLNALPREELFFYQEEKIASYPSAIAFFKHLKRIGAGTALEKPLTHHEMQRLMNHWNAMSPNAVTVTYDVLYVAALQAAI